MQLKCTKCQKALNIPDEKLPLDKERAMLKCPACQQVIVFNIPQALRKPSVPFEKTIITQAPIIPQKFRPRLCHASENIEYQLKNGKNVIGRDATISIPADPYISRRHCLIEMIEKNELMLGILTDDGSINESGEPSTNGTFYNGIRLTRYDKIYLNHGDKVRIGHTDFIFKND